MADENMEDEYHFTDVDEGESQASDTSYETEGATADKSESSEQMKKYGLMALGILIVVFGIYKVAGMVMGDKEVAKTEVVSEVPKFGIPQPQEQKPILIPSAPVAPQKTAKVTPETANVLAQIAKELSEVNQKLSNLDSRVLDLGEHQEKINEKIQNQSKQIAKLKAKKKQSLKSKKPIKYTIYHIKAVVLGRAWLIAENGSTLTVRTGDRLPGYGKVTVIDPMHGRVLTSSGKEIRFSPDER